MNAKHPLLTVCFTWFALSLSVSGQQVINIAEEWKFSVDPEVVGAQERWEALDYDDSAWETLDAGMRWEDQGVGDFDGHGWYRKWVTVPDAWLTRSVYLAFGGINDCATVYVNGEKAATLGYFEDSQKKVSIAREFQVVDITSYIKAGADNLTTKSGAKILIAVDVFDWGKSGGLWVLPCVLSLNPDSISGIEASCAVDYGARELLISVQQVNKQTLPLAGEFKITLTPDGENVPVLDRRVPIVADALPTEFALPLPYTPDAVTYTVDVTAITPEGALLEDVAARTKVFWPAQVVRGAAYAEAVPLNNFVAQLYNKKCRADTASLTFTNPKAGWVFFSISRPDGLPEIGRAHV